MKYNTGKSSKKVSSGASAYYYRKLEGNLDKPSDWSKKYLKKLIDIAIDNEIHLEAHFFRNVENDKDGVSTMRDIDILSKRIRDAGIDLPLNPVEQKRKEKEDAEKKIIRESVWHDISKEKPKRRIVRVYCGKSKTAICEWDGRYFIDNLGSPIITGKHKFSTPKYWAYLGDK